MSFLNKTGTRTVASSSVSQKYIMTKIVATIATTTDMITNPASCFISRIHCRPYWVADNESLAISPLIFSCGKATPVGTSQPKKSHSGFQPCLTLYNNSFSGGTRDLTRWLCSRYRLRKTVVDLGFVVPRAALR